MKFYQHEDLDPTKRILVFGDVHGAYHLVAKAKHDLGITDDDIKIFVGDLTDRGTQNFKCVMEAMRKPNTYCIRGNHEDMMIRGMLDGDRRYYQCWYQNGGDTVFDELKTEEAVTALAMILEEAPVMLTVSHGDNNYAFVHAEYPSVISHIPVWFLEATLKQNSAIEQVSEMMMWNRDLIECIKEGVDIPPVLGVDAVFHGHTPVRKPVIAQNRHYIDTGGVFNENLTVAVIDPGKDIWYYSTLLDE